MNEFSGEIHPAAALFPMMADTELDQLAADIKANGLRQPIVLDGDGRLLDGRNRLRACELASVQPEFVSVNGDDPVGLVVSLNVRRRNLTASQRAIAAADACQISDMSARKGADLFGINHTYVAQARALVERDPDAASAVKAGTKTLAVAYEELRERERETESDRVLLNDLRDTYPDLAELVQDGTITLLDALRKSEAEDRLRQLEDDLVERVRAGTLGLSEAETITAERRERVAAWVGKVREALMVLSRMVGSPIPADFQEALTESEREALVVVLDVIPKGVGE